jgi:hypothetical protein
MFRRKWRGHLRLRSAALSREQTYLPSRAFWAVNKG